MSIFFSFSLKDKKKDVGEKLNSINLLAFLSSSHISVLCKEGVLREVKISLQPAYKMIYIILKSSFFITSR